MWSETERQVLDDLTRDLHARGWASHVTVENLLGTWREVAHDVNRYKLTVDDFTNDLTARDALEEVLRHCRNEEVCKKLMTNIDEADQNYRAATDEDGGVALSRYYRVDSASGWWWRRCPRSGALADYLKAT